MLAASFDVFPVEKELACIYYVYQEKAFRVNDISLITMKCITLCLAMLVFLDSAIAQQDDQATQLELKIRTLDLAHAQAIF